MSDLRVSNKTIGSGAFASVYKAKLRFKSPQGHGSSEEYNDVAVKVPHKASTKHYRYLANACHLRATFKRGGIARDRHYVRDRPEPSHVASNRSHMRAGVSDSCARVLL